MAVEPGVPSPEPVPPIIVPPQPNDPKPSVPPNEDGTLPAPPIKLPGQPGAPERV